MSAYQIYNIFSGICIGALIMTWIGAFIYLWQERRHRAELNRLQQQIIAEVKNSLRK
ncbi:hypothetical protein [uncultured Pantoea sp.]|jgi:uncharacterized SAM-binding protein YcdF (DUF218 family)|uniref:hypothetical protein n=1 Tax=uncultured Pantoea sp. TaxID=218084 RepID=UPI0025E1D5D8|nr:hypothetical protein [uncultured Pantoea sp.]